MADMKVKIMIGNEVKGTFINPINLTPKRKNEKIEQPLLKTTVSRLIDTGTPYQNTNETLDMGIITKLIRPLGKPTQSLITETKSEIEPKVEKSDYASVDISDRASTEEEMIIFDSIESIHEDDRTENENAFMELYADGNCPPLDELEKALIPIREERAMMEAQYSQYEVAASTDIDNQSDEDEEDDVETFERIKSSKKRVLDEY